MAGGDRRAALGDARAAADALTQAVAKLDPPALTDAAPGDELLRLHTLVLVLHTLADDVNRAVHHLEHAGADLASSGRARLPAPPPSARRPSAWAWWRRARPS
jgi:hypothetical protein